MPGKIKSAEIVVTKIKPDNIGLRSRACRFSGGTINGGLALEAGRMIV